jgi:thioredoxin-like negative regulator of GroEL
MLAMTLDEIDSKIPIEVIDIDVYPETAQEYGIRGVPTLVLLEENIETKRMSGTKTKTDLEQWLIN